MIFKKDKHRGGVGVLPVVGCCNIGKGWEYLTYAVAVVECPARTRNLKFSNLIQ